MTLILCLFTRWHDPCSALSMDGADLAKCFVEAMEGKQREIEVCGSRVMTYREIAELAFETLGRPVRISTIPRWLIRAWVAVTKFFNKHQGELLAFFTTMMTNDVVAPKTGTRGLDAHFHELSGVS